ncbi:hypothetical protein Z517_05770 [Fonsecaea pedrosoi CBS 271.37]|uniref:FAD-binding domain-containing protein n=1 Tax=Fonsecaea pedrosoi CBS 271.37 TaxID=1442368 RepID=A0A0D2GEF6_9EURO|nr:uncharacterized protein Z517_05770 [Fonsecaea pedrosoi CBS 271.37]KIW79158.1 hypothetical protein Z517_05770 [Fonsecaea pedrosoi CBS 271.37]
MAADDGVIREELSPDTVLIAGGGPVGLLLAAVLSRYGVRSVLVERNKSTTQWPKMDLTNARSMEILRRLGLAEELRTHGVRADIPQPVLFCTGLPAPKALTSWQHESVDQFQARINSTNDGTLPLEPWQRVSQVVFEAWLKDRCEHDPLIELRYGWKVEGVKENVDQVETVISNVDTGVTSIIVSKYVAGCDGANSRVRQSLKMPLDGGPIPAFVLLVHFKSKDLSRLHKLGQFWHIFFFQQSGEFSGAIIAQDEVDTWTTHLFLPLDADESKIDSHEAIYEALGGSHGPYPIKVDKILVRSTWRPNIAVTRQWTSPMRRVFLAGDSAHQLIPTGGYGMNTGLGDAYDLGWKLASSIKGHGGLGLLGSYEAERRPVALRNSEHSGVHMQTHQSVKHLINGLDIATLNSDSEEAIEARRKIHEHYQTNNGENLDLGIEMGFRYRSTVILTEGDDIKEPEWSPSRYIPTTWPGSRPPHVFLKDGTPIFDLFHPTDWTLVTFGEGCEGIEHMLQSAQESNIPVKHLHLVGETVAEKLWERKMVLVRPDQHVAWRGDSVASLATARDIVATTTGKKQIQTEAPNSKDSKLPKHAFTATTQLMTQVDTFGLEKMSDFQR